MGGSPWGLYGQSMRSPRRVYEESTESLCGIHETVFHGVCEDSTWSLWRLLGTSGKCSMESSQTLHGVSMESSWTPWKRVGECKVLPFAFGFCTFYGFFPICITLHPGWRKKNSLKNSLITHRKGYSPTRTLSCNLEVVFYILIIFIDIYTASISTLSVVLFATTCCACDVAVGVSHVLVWGCVI